MVTTESKANLSLHRSWKDEQHVPPTYMLQLEENETSSVYIQWNLTYKATKRPYLSEDWSQTLSSTNYIYHPTTFPNAHPGNQLHAHSTKNFALRAQNNPNPHSCHLARPHSANPTTTTHAPTRHSPKSPLYTLQQTTFDFTPLHTRLYSFYHLLFIQVTYSHSYCFIFWLLFTLHWLYFCIWYTDKRFGVISIGLLLILILT